jgi:hypothetical protein
MSRTVFKLSEVILKLKAALPFATPAVRPEALQIIAKMEKAFDEHGDCDVVLTTERAVFLPDSADYSSPPRLLN